MNKSNSEKWMKNFAGAKSLEEVVLMSAKVNKSLSCRTAPDSEDAVTARNMEHYADKKKIASLNIYPIHDKPSTGTDKLHVYTALFTYYLLSFDFLEV